MFDSVFFECPECGEEFEEQTKAGPCLMYRFYPDSVRTDVALAFKNKRVGCPGCKSIFKAEVNAPRKVSIDLILIDESDDEMYEDEED